MSVRIFFSIFFSNFNSYFNDLVHKSLVYLMANQSCHQIILIEFIRTVTYKTSIEISSKYTDHGGMVYLVGIVSSTDNSNMD